MKANRIAAILPTLWLVTALMPSPAQEPSKEQRLAWPYCIVDTGQTHIFDDRGQLLKVPKPSEPFFGQDGFYQGAPPSYTPSSDGLTVYDNNTGLTWQSSPGADSELPRGGKLTWAQAQKHPAALNAANYGGYSDWRLQTIKDTSGLTPFLDAKYFQFTWGQVNLGQRIIDSQYASSTLYVNKTWRGFDKLFGVNFADGRIKGYDLAMPGGRELAFWVQCVRGNPNYGQNDFRDNNDGTITDRATGRMWSKADSGKGMSWEESLAWVQAKNREKYLGHNDWRLPTAKELHSLVDYTRSPDTTSSAAIDPLFVCAQITNEARQTDYACYWSGTTHGAAGGRAAVYIAFGRAMGYMMGAWHDVHGAGAQRSDPKTGDPANFPQGRGPQGDAIRIDNYVRPVRSTDPSSSRLVKPALTPLPVLRLARGPGGGPEGPRGPEGGFHLIPRFAAEQMNLTPDQQEQLAKLAAEAKAELDKILTPAQQKTLDEARPPLPGRPGGGPGGGGPPGVGPDNRKPPLGEDVSPAQGGRPTRR
ncbi:MAG: DUF1566 domain-containing protein [Planctomycetota bacterium]|nr:DUF1566 domain-containing protein [Planctomycetota bacterium]